MLGGETLEEANIAICFAVFKNPNTKMKSYLFKKLA